MEVYVYEGKKEEEVLTKALTDLNVTENDILLKKEKNKGGLFKSETYKLTIVKITDIQEEIKTFLKDLLNKMDIDVTFESNIREKQIKKLDELIKSQFLEMFGDININDKKWNEDILKNNLSVVGGYAFKSSEFQENGIPILRIGNINTGQFRPKDLMFWKEEKSLENYE